MQCPYCNYKESKVVDSRHTDSNSIRRRRECESCKKDTLLMKLLKQHL